MSRLGILGREAARRWRVILAWTTGVVFAGGLVYFAYWKLLEGAWIRYNKWDRRERGTLQVGHRAPDLELPLIDDSRVRLAELWRARPAVLVFGSCT